MEHLHDFLYDPESNYVDITGIAVPNGFLTFLLQSLVLWLMYNGIFSLRMWESKINSCVGSHIYHWGNRA